MPLRNAPSQLPTTLAFMASRLARRLRMAAPPQAADFRKRVDAALAGLNGVVKSCDWIEVTPAGESWFETGITLAAGESLTLLAGGMLHVSKLFDVGFGPGMGLWYRVGEGELAKLIGPEVTITADRAGPLRFVTKPPGEFADRLGAFDAGQPRSGVSGVFAVAAIRWLATPAEGLAAAAASSPEVFGAALRRLREPVTPPPGWHYLWRLGDGEIFRTAPDASGTGGDLCCGTAGDVGILQFPLELALTADTRLDWSWMVTQLPSRLPEHIQPTHDYLSIAIEFDNGLDLTYMWSAGLPVGTIFQCPLAWWDQRETHWVVRSDSGDLGRWLDESRSVLADYEIAIGGPPPGRVVAVWLIANTVFQRGVGECRYRGIMLSGGGQKIVVHP